MLSKKRQKITAAEPYKFNFLFACRERSFLLYTIAPMPELRVN